jgi:membrane protein implicated in regulation of membrane protease activity
VLNVHCHLAGGLVTIAAALFQACCLVVVILGFFVSKFLVSGFFHPITLAVFAAAEFCVLYYSGRLYRGEERKLTQDLLALFHPWRQEYGITAKMRKITGQIAVERGGGLVTATYFCLVLEKTMSANDDDTVSLSAQTETDMGSDMDSQV